jgi:hypothetical protein
MTGATSFVASAAVGGLLVVTLPATTIAGPGGLQEPHASPVARPVSSAPGSITGVVQDERGLPVANVVVSALGATTTVATTDTTGRYEFGTLTPGPYLVRAHVTGYIAPKGRVVEVPASGRTTCPIAVRRENAVQILAAGVGPGDLTTNNTPTAAAEPTDASSTATGSTDSTDDHSETAWRVRHSRRSVLKDATLPEEMLAGADDASPVWGEVRHTSGSSSWIAGLLSDVPITGQVNFLTAGSFDSPQQLFSPDTAARNIANLRLAGRAGDDADWTAVGALSQSDISSWVVAGSYSVRAPARHRYDLGISYSTQRYDGGNPLALKDVTDGSRNVGTAYGYDSITLSPHATVALGGEFARYDYLTQQRAFLSPRAEVTLSPASDTRLLATVSRRAVAPGAEEFLPPSDTGLWLPPQRTFSSFDASSGMRAEHALNVSLGAEHDLGTSTVGLRGFSQRTSDQLVTVFGADLPGQPSSDVGHYLVGNAGDVIANGMTAEFRAVIASRVHGNVEYSVAHGQIFQSDNGYLMLLAPVAANRRTEMVQDMTARLDAQVPETATRVMVVYRLSNGFTPAMGAPSPARSKPVDSRFDVQIRQSLPFMNFTNAKWEMLFAVRNFFRDANTQQSLYDELFVVRPPKRVVGGVTLHF